jgi:hypothetical protein
MGRITSSFLLLQYLYNSKLSHLSYNNAAGGARGGVACFRFRLVLRFERPLSHSDKNHSVKQHGAAGIARRAHNWWHPEVPRSKRGAATFLSPF